MEAEENMKNKKMGEMSQTRPKRYLEAHTTENERKGQLAWQ